MSGRGAPPRLRSTALADNRKRAASSGTTAGGTKPTAPRKPLNVKPSSHGTVAIAKARGANVKLGNAWSAESPASSTSVKADASSGTTVISGSEAQRGPTLSQTQEACSTASDSLSAAAQAQSWLFMSSTLEKHLSTATRAADSALENRSKELAVEEADIADSRIRFEAQRLLDLYEELANPAVASDIPRIVQTFLDIERACSETLSSALEMASSPAGDISEFRAMLSHIDELQQGILRLESFILSTVNSSRSSKTRVIVILEALLGVVRAHSDNLTSARSLVQVSKNVTQTRLYLQSLRVSG